MNVTESIFSAISGILGNKTRSILTMFGIIVGISSVMMITSVGAGYRESMNRQFEEIGLDRINLSVLYTGDTVIEDSDQLTTEDIETIRKIPGVRAAGASSPNYGVGQSLENLNGDSMFTMIQGVDGDFQQISNLKLAAGRTFITPDMESASPVTVIDEDLARALFGRADVLGEEIEISTWGETITLTVVGVTKSDQQSAMFAMYNYARFSVPITYFQGLFGLSYVGQITIKADDVNNVAALSQNVIRIMEAKHENDGKYSASTVSDELAQVDSIIGLFTLFMGIVAGISLFVGGIGVMNIMLVSVTERTQEIGIRKSLGATEGNISFQFLVEAVIITAIGGALGIIFGYLGGMGFGSLASMLLGESVTPYISASTIGLVVAFSAAIGIVFGVYPAMKAARLDPIEALRFE